MSNPDKPVSGSKSQHAVLVVDDEILERLAVSEYLRNCGFRVIEAATTDEALIALGQENLPIDVVLSDVGVSGSLDGFGLAQWLREHKPGLPIILAATPARAAAAAGDLCEEGPMLAKPYDPQILLDQIRSTLANAAAASQETGNEP
jgi:DNA-binding response OmpR family regulator